MRYALILAGCMVVAGCSQMFPEFPRIPDGSPATIRGTRFAEVFHPAGREWRRSEWEFNDILVEEGVGLTVLEDRGDVSARSRRVLVRVEGGPKRGNVYQMERDSVTPDQHSTATTHQ